MTLARICKIIPLIFFSIVSFAPKLRAQQKTEIHAIVFGFVGGFVKHDNPVHAEVQLAARLRQTYPSGVDVETFESHRGEEAHAKILALLAGEGRRAPTAEQKRSARIILYGHSWGAAAAIEIARELQKDGVPVLLTIQVDSIAKVGHNDTTIPSNVAQAANFYQTHGILHGNHPIRAADPSHTKIIGNFLFDYTNSPLKCSRYPWWDRYIVRAHTQIECDPVVWNRVDSLIRAALPLPTQSQAK
jgi:hypothetical protein